MTSILSAINKKIPSFHDEYTRRKRLRGSESERQKKEEEEEEEMEEKCQRAGGRLDRRERGNED